MSRAEAAKLRLAEREAKQLADAKAELRANTSKCNGTSPPPTPAEARAAARDQRLLDEAKAEIAASKRNGSSAPVTPAAARAAERDQRLIAEAKAEMAAETQRKKGESTPSSPINETGRCVCRWVL